MTNNKKDMSESDMMAMKPEGFVLILNEKGAEWLKQKKPLPDQREFFQKRAEKLNIVKPYEPKA